MINCIPPQRDWIDIFAALLTPAIAILASYIAVRQWLTNKNKLKLDLFDKRYAVFEAITVNMRGQTPKMDTNTFQTDRNKSVLK